MTMSDIERRLPAGFHDAKLLALDIDYTSSSARFDFDLWTPTDEEAETYARASIFIQSFQYIVVEKPLTGSGQQNPNHSQSSVDGYTTAEHPGHGESLPTLNDGHFAHSLFVYGWNSSIHIAAVSASLEPAELLESESNPNEI